MKKFVASIVTFQLFFSLAIPLTSAQAVTPPPSTAAITSLKQNIQKTIDANKEQIQAVGAYIVDEKGTVLFSTNPDKLYPPASNLKLYVAAAALERLGADFKTKTSVYAFKPDTNGVIKGDVILYGRGEYNLSGRFNQGDSLQPFQLLVQQLKQRGVKEIQGNVVGDDSYFDSSLVGDGIAQADLQWYYGAEVSALSVGDNSMKIKVMPGTKAGSTATTTMTPPNSFVTIVNKVQTVAKGKQQNLEIKRGLQDNIFEISGSIPMGDAGRTFNMAVHNPPLFAATLFKDVLQKNGIKVTGKSIAMTAKERKTEPLVLTKYTEMASLTSVPLQEEVKIMMKESNNLHAELLLRLMGANLRDVFMSQGGVSREALPTIEKIGIICVKDFLNRAHIDYKVLAIADGAGLSEKDFVTAKTTYKLMRYLQDQPYSALFFDAFPIAGVDGTLKNRFVDTKISGKLRGKTGTLDNVSALSGYLSLKEDKKIYFSIMAVHKDPNVSGSKLVIDPIITTLADYQQSL